MVEVVEKPEERNWPPTAKLALAAVYVALIVVAWWYFADPTRGAYARSDSPDGKYRCVVIGDTQCQFAVFEQAFYHV